MGDNQKLVEKMTTRNLSKLSETKEFQELIDHNSMSLLIKDGSLLLKNSNIYIYIYCYVINGYADFTLFDVKNSTYCSDIRYLISDIINDDIIQIYKFYEETHLKSIINEGIPGEIIMESSLLARIEILKKYFPDLLEGNLNKYKKYFNPLQGGYISLYNELKIFVNKGL